MVQTFMTNIREKLNYKVAVETLFGRRLYLPDIHSSNAMRRKGAERVAITFNARYSYGYYQTSDDNYCTGDKK